MATAQQILQFHFSGTSLKHSASQIIPTSVEALNNHHIHQLQQITEEVGATTFTFSGYNLIPQVFRKFKNAFHNKGLHLERRELRTLTYSLNYSEHDIGTIFKNANELEYALSLLESNWRDSFLTGLIDCFLRNWETKNALSLGLMEQFILKKLEKYTGNRTTLNSFKKYKQYFNSKNGNVVLGDTIAKLNKSIREAPSFLGVPASWFQYAYFSKVIVTYFERNKPNSIDDIEELYEVLTSHNHSVTNKRLISKNIIRLNQPQSVILQDKIKGIAFKQIGDPENTANWMPFDGASDSEKQEIAKARTILNEWITREFINVFFNVCINDDRRKKFWLRFASKISSFKVYGPLQTKVVLKRNPRITEYVNARFETVSSKKDISAFILYIGEYTLIEFSNEGYAFYAYKNDSPYKPNLKYQLTSVDELRNGSIPMAVQSDAYYDYFHDEGRLTHRDGNQIWETKFNNWMNKKVFK
jgi:hypothetical protein